MTRNKALALVALCVLVSCTGGNDDDATDNGTPTETEDGIDDWYLMSDNAKCFELVLRMRVAEEVCVRGKPSDPAELLALEDKLVWELLDSVDVALLQQEACATCIGERGIDREYTESCYPQLPDWCYSNRPSTCYDAAVSECTFDKACYPAINNVLACIGY